MNYQGDYKEDATVYLMFNTFTSNDPSASSTITNFINTDVHIHKDDDLTQRNNAAGITVSVNFDGITGSHMIKIDTNDNTVAGFWVTGKDYFVRIEGTTVDGATINAVVGHFSIENRHNEVDVVKWLGQACHAVSENGVPKVDLDQIGGVVQSLTDFKDLVDTGYDPTNHKMQSDLIYIHGSALTETAGQLAAAFVKLFDVATPLLVASDVMVGTNNANTVVPDAAGVAPTASEIQTEMEAAGSDLDYMMIALINKMIITEANGNTEQFNDAGSTLGSIAAAYSTDGTYTTRKRMVI